MKKNLLAALMLLLIFSACVTKTKFLKYGNKHPETAAEFCADKFPEKDSLIKGKTDTVINTVIRDGKTIECPQANVDPATGLVRKVYVKCPGETVIYKTISATDTIIRVDKAKEAVLLYRYANEVNLREKTEADRDKYQGKFETYRKATFGLGLIILAIGFFKIRKLISMPIL